MEKAQQYSRNRCHVTANLTGGKFNKVFVRLKTQAESSRKFTGV